MFYTQALILIKLLILLNVEKEKLKLALLLLCHIISHYVSTHHHAKECHWDKHKPILVITQHPCWHCRCATIAKYIIKCHCHFSHFAFWRRKSMASILRSSKFVRYIAGFARNVIINTPREFDGNLVNTSHCFCGGIQR